MANFGKLFATLHILCRLFLATASQALDVRCVPYLGGIRFAITRMENYRSVKSSNDCRERLKRRLT